LQQEHLTAYKAAYGTDAMKPKFHLSLHLPRQYLRDGFVFDTFTTERKHRLVKAAVSDCTTSARGSSGRSASRTTFESTILARVLHGHVQGLGQARWSFNVQLLSNRKVQPCFYPALAEALGARAVQIAERVFVRYRTLEVGYILEVNGDAASILSCMFLDGSPHVLLQLFEHVGKLGYADKWKKQPGTVAFSLLSAYGLFSHWHYDSDGLLFTLR